MTTTALLELMGGLIGGLSLFLYGMSIMSAGLQAAAGGKLEKLLASITHNKLIAWLFGVGVTALMQSSSASTVMVVGLVNSGMMTLHEAVNIILGANLGTTFTAWLLSLNAISSDNIVMLLFKPSTFTPYLALTGIALLMFSQKDKRKNLAGILLGFSVLMFGMQMMSGAVAPLKSSQSFIRFLTNFSNPLIGFMVGLLFTMVIQSSAGTIGVLQALSLSIALTYRMSIPVVIGAEVGTCITAILSSLGAGKNGKRTALMHLYFNLIKAISFMVIFYSLNSILHFAFLDWQSGMVGIAGIHTLVNLIASPLMLPFSGVLVNLAMLTIPTDAREKKAQDAEAALQILDPRFLSNPPFALEQSLVSTREMAGYALEITRKAGDLIFAYSQGNADEVDMLERRIDRYEDALGSYLIKINGSRLTAEENQRLSVLLHCVGDFERIADHALNIMQIAQRMHEEQREFSSLAAADMKVFRKAIDEILSLTVKAFCDDDFTIAREIEPLEEVIDGLTVSIKHRHVERLRHGLCTVDLGFDLGDLCTDYERIADHCSNIAIDLLLSTQDQFDTHEYLDLMKAQDSLHFHDAVAQYEIRYQLPALPESAVKC